MNLAYSVTDRLLAGLEYNERINELRPNVNWRVVSESAKNPAVIVGTSSDRIGTPHGGAYYLTLSKDLSRELREPVAPYIGASYSEFQSRFLVIAGANVSLGNRFSFMPIYDGVNLHQSLTYSWDRHSLTLLAVRSREVGVTYGIRF